MGARTAEEEAERRSREVEELKAKRDDYTHVTTAYDEMYDEAKGVAREMAETTRKKRLNTTKTEDLEAEEKREKEQKSALDLEMKAAQEKNERGKKRTDAPGQRSGEPENES